MAGKGGATIYGAGMSGLIAAIDLARHGYEVTVHEREPDYGGDARYNPSTHTTPIDLEMTSAYLGIDISPVFHPLLSCPFYFHETVYNPPLHILDMYTVERGNRPTSLDTLLYGEARKLGVRFEFDSPLRKEDIAGLPDNTIIACGLSPGAYEMLGIPYLRWYGWCSRGEIGFSNISWLWFDESITEYGYMSSCNNYYFDFLFSTRHVDRADLDRYQDFIMRHQGVEHSGEWTYISGAVPLASRDNPRLFHRRLILCGTMSGAMDPMLWFGILGAMIAGKVAAMAVYDRARAEEDFRRFTRRFAPMLWFKNNLWYRLIRPHVSLLDLAIRSIGERRYERLAEVAFRHGLIKIALPGFSRLGTY